MALLSRLKRWVSSSFPIAAQHFPCSQSAAIDRTIDRFSDSPLIPSQSDYICNFVFLLIFYMRLCQTDNIRTIFGWNMMVVDSNNNNINEMMTTSIPPHSKFNPMRNLVCFVCTSTLQCLSTSPNYHFHDGKRSSFEWPMDYAITTATTRTLDDITVAFQRLFHK